MFVVPGSIFSKVSKGKHQLIKQGANLIDCADDILNFLNLSKKLNDIEKLNMRKNLKDEEAKIYSEISEAATGISLDNLVFKTRNPPSEISVIITSLELKGLIKRGLAGEFLLLK
ncbi:MAG: hypothetical protein COU52_00005 [Candidatus Omnitrophica bacterium CG10_big_fil_rev_8_21_14_0_10_43_8]|nr:MAG: hypothetical protein COU52_00005 [Candidatus Omnitrophica bacterium CG10_big_fil_rev_8_21_14_0_10_43_8]